MAWKVGSEITSHELHVNRLDIAWMAVALQDPNLIHVEDAVARSSGLPQVVAHGTFPVGLIGTMLGGLGGTVRRLSVRLTAPTYPGDVVRARGKIVAAEEGRLTVEVEASAGDRTVARGTAEVESLDRPSE